MCVLHLIFHLNVICIIVNVCWNLWARIRLLLALRLSGKNSYFVLLYLQHASLKSALIIFTSGKKWTICNIQICRNICMVQWIDEDAKYVYCDCVHTKKKWKNEMDKNFIDENVHKWEYGHNYNCQTDRISRENSKVFFFLFWNFFFKIVKRYRNLWTFSICWLV